jgi:hypothetical protein
MTQFINVINKYTKRAVAFTYLANGEIQIVSPFAEDTEENCIIEVSRTCYGVESWDYEYFLECIENGRLNAKTK